MLQAQYERLGLHVSASPREVIRAARERVAVQCRLGPYARKERHGFYKSMLRQHVKAQKLYRFVMRGGR